MMCKVLGVSRSGYYSFTHGKPSLRENNNKKLDLQIKEVFNQHKQMILNILSRYMKIFLIEIFLRPNLIKNGQVILVI